MRLVFWMAVAIVGYTYFGYAAWLWVRTRFRARPVRAASYLPPISLVLVVRNEAESLPSKLENLSALSYPEDRFEIVLVSDGSTDGTNRILSEFASNTPARVVLNSDPRGKAAGLNDAIKSSTGDIVVFTDVRQKIERDAVVRLLENFADPEVGCASGELVLGDPDSGEAACGMGLYWKFEKMVRRMESASGSVAGATGALYAVRRNLLPPVPAETVLDDVFIPMHVLRQGFRVVFDPRAKAWDLPDLGMKREFERKVRTLSGNYQLLQLQPWLLTRANPIRFGFISHKLLRLIVPFALLAILFTSCFLSEPLYRVALIGQAIFYSLSLSVFARLKQNPLTQIATIAFTFILLNTAALAAFANFVARRKAFWGGPAK